MSRRVIDDELYAHFVTFSVDRRRRLLDLSRPKQIVLGCLQRQLRRQSAKCVGFVLMPDHVHAILWFAETHQLSRFMKNWKRISSFYIRKWYSAQQSEYFRSMGAGDRFWQPRYHAFAIYSATKLREKLAYVHRNPVRAGLVDEPAEYQWSSARWYEQRQSVGVPISWVD